MMAAAVTAVVTPAQAAAPVQSPVSSRIDASAFDDIVQLPGTSYGPVDNSLYRLGEVGNEFGLIDGIGVYTGLNMDVASVIDSYARDTFGGLFAYSPAIYSPYLNEASGGAYAGLRIMLADGLRFNFGQAFSRAGRNPYLLSGRANWAGYAALSMPFDRMKHDTVLAGLSWDFAKWGGISMAAAQTTTQGNMGALGNAEAAISRSRLMSLGVSAHVGFGNGWVTTLAYNQGASQLSISPGAGDEAVHSQSYGIAVAKQGLFGHDALGLSLSHPAGGYNTPASIGAEMQQFQFYGRDKLLSGVMPETDIELGYITTFMGGPLSLQANAGYQLHYNGQNRDSLSFMSRAKIKF
ncbi:MAG: hypothetical protein WCD42_13710 [Rhizomicrobium sp.]